MEKFATDSSWVRKSILFEKKGIGYISIGVVEKRRAGFISLNRSTKGNKKPGQ
jgi:hypothetical protein